MRALTIEETRSLLCKVVKYKKANLLLYINIVKKNLVIFRIQKFRIYETFLGIARQSENFQEHHLGSIGCCISRFTHSGKLILLIPSLKLISDYPSSASLGLTRNGESIFLKGSHLSQKFFDWANKNLVRGEGVSIIGPSGIILGFGEIIQKIKFQKPLESKTISLANHGDIGSYTRIY